VTRKEVPYHEKHDESDLAKVFKNVKDADLQK
jgi:hypothetical protein